MENQIIVFDGIFIKIYVANSRRQISLLVTQSACLLQLILVIVQYQFSELLNCYTYNSITLRYWITPIYIFYQFSLFVCVDGKHLLVNVS